MRKLIEKRPISSVLKDKEVVDIIKEGRYTIYITQYDDTRKQYAFSVSSRRLPARVRKQIVSICGDIPVWYIFIDRELYGTSLINFRLGGNLDG